MALIPLLRNVKYSDVELRFGQDVADLTKSAESSSLPAKPSKEQGRKWEDELKLAAVRARTAIRSAFRKLEDLLTDTARAKSIEISDGALGIPMVTGALLLKDGIIDRDQYDLLSRLRAL
jgi:hypothetical protein